MSAGLVAVLPARQWPRATEHFRESLSLVYLRLPAPDTVPDEIGRRLHEAQLELLRPPYADDPANTPQPPEQSAFSPSHRVAWLGPDPDDANRMALWVRPTIARFARGVLEDVEGLPLSTAP